MPDIFALFKGQALIDFGIPLVAIVVAIAYGVFMRWWAGRSTKDDSSISKLRLQMMAYNEETFSNFAKDSHSDPYVLKDRQLTWREFFVLKHIVLLLSLEAIRPLTVCVVVLAGIGAAILVSAGESLTTSLSAWLSVFTILALLVSIISVLNHRRNVSQLLRGLDKKVDEEDDQYSRRKK